MSKKQAIILFFSAILIGFLAIQPFNLICKITEKCNPIILSYYFPSIIGNKDFDIVFEVKNQTTTEIDFSAQMRSMILTDGQKVEVNYVAKNLSDKDIKIRPKLYVFPPEAKKYIKFYDCLCFKEHKIGKNKSKNLSVKFVIDKKIEKDQLFEENNIIRIGYEI